jgi:hypothetical protein
MTYPRVCFGKLRYELSDPKLDAVQVKTRLRELIVF